MSENTTEPTSPTFGPTSPPPSTSTSASISSNKLDQSLDSIISSKRSSSHRSQRHPERRHAPYARPPSDQYDRNSRRNAPRGVPTFHFDSSLHSTPLIPPPAINPFTFSNPYSYSSSIYVTNLPHNLSESDIRTVFSEISNDLKIQLFYDAKGHTVGKCEITFSTSAQAQEALTEFDGAEINSAKVQVRLLASSAPVPDKSAIQFSMPMPIPSIPSVPSVPIHERGRRDSRNTRTHSDRPDRPNRPSVGDRDTSKRIEGSRKRLQTDDLDAEMEEYYKKKHESSRENEKSVQSATTEADNTNPSV
jgi:RNA recognition motif-containing protein